MPIVVGTYLYWTDWVKVDGSSAKIWQSRLDGSERTVLYDKSLRWPNGLSLDPGSNMLYWCDAWTDRVERLDLNTRVSV